jgi:hypothetical protein
MTEVVEMVRGYRGGNDRTPASELQLMLGGDRKQRANSRWALDGRARGIRHSAQEGG